MASQYARDMVKPRRSLSHFAPVIIRCRGLPVPNHSGYPYSLTNPVIQLNNPLLHKMESPGHCVDIFLGWIDSFFILLKFLWPTYVPQSCFNTKDRRVRCEGNSVKFVYGYPLRKCKTFGDRVFQSFAPTLWNQLPTYIRMAEDTASF